MMSTEQIQGQSMEADPFKFEPRTEKERILRSETTTDIVKEKAMNAYYYLQSVISKKPQEQVKVAYFLGQEITAATTDSVETNEYKGLSAQEIIMEKVKKKMQSMIWMTYRKKFSKLLGDSEYCDDNGWGCMIRVGQMILAQGMKQHLKGRDWKMESKLDLTNLILAFADDDFEDNTFGQYSIQKIAKEAFSIYKLKPGQWYAPNQILYVLECLHQKRQKAGTQNLAVKMYCLAHDSVVFEELLTLMGLTLCTHKRQSEDKVDYIFCPQCEQEQKEVEDNNNNSNNTVVKKALMLHIMCRIGTDRPELNYLQVVNELFKHKYSIGMIGGRGDRALYFTTIFGEYYVYLDPHNVQLATDNKNITEQIETYFCQDMLMCKQTEIAASMSLGFYVKNGKELNELWLDMNTIQRQNSDSFFILMEKAQKKFQKYKEFKFSEY